MADTTTAITQTEPEQPEAQKVQQRFPAWHRLALAGITLISIFMNFYLLGKNGYGSYYPPAVRSMMNNWHNFFFSSYDPGGFVTVDKPPVGFWFQVLSAKLFGFTPFSILLPQALAGVLSVLLLYYLVRRHFGVVAGLLAALGLALTPISIVTNRNITIDSTLALTLLVGAWAVLRAAETGRLRWLLLSAAIVGIGFNIKMLEAYLVVPAFGLLYLLAAPRSIWKRIGHLALAGLVLLVVSFSWIAAVDLTPPSQRPYVDSTRDNSELSLALGYNGIERLLGRFGRGFGGGPGARNSPNTANRSGNNSGTFPTPGNNGLTNNGGNGVRQRQQPGGPGGAGGLFDLGNPGPLRLFTEPLGGQIVWLLPLALLGILALAWQPLRSADPQGRRDSVVAERNKRKPLRSADPQGRRDSVVAERNKRKRRPNFQEDRKLKSLVLWGAWLLTMGIFFSVAGFFHQYYMTVMAPAIAALFGIGLVTMWQDFRRGGWRGWLLPLALIVTVAEQIYILSSHPAWGQWMIPLIVVLSILAVAVLVSARLAPLLRVKAPGSRFFVPALCAGVLALLLAPTVWAIIPVTHGTQADTLVAGPVQADGAGFNFAGRSGENSSTNSSLIRYLEANQGSVKFLVAVPSSMTADGIILATNKPVMALGGFSGSDPILTTSQLAYLVANGTVRFFLLNSFNERGQIPPQILNQIPQQFRNRPPGGFGGGQQSALTSWVTQHCKTVPASLWQSPSTGAGSGGFGPARASQLYDCATPK